MIVIAPVPEHVFTIVMLCQDTDKGAVAPVKEIVKGPLILSRLIYSNRTATFIKQSANINVVESHSDSILDGLISKIPSGRGMMIPPDCKHF